MKIADENHNNKKVTIIQLLCDSQSSLLISSFIINNKGKLCIYDKESDTLFSVVLSPFFLSNMKILFFSI